MFPPSPFAHPTGSFNAPVVPPDVDPDSDPSVTVRVSSAWLPYIRGAMSQLLLQSTWDVADGTEYETVIGRVRDLFRIVSDQNVQDCDCLQVNGNIVSKFVPDGHGGGSFQPIDPRTEGTVPPPWTTPPSGQTGECLSAANIMKVFEDMMADMEAKLVAAASISQLLVIVEAWFALALGPLGIVVELATEFAAAAIDAGAVTVGLAFDPTTQTAAYHGCQCILQCNMSADGSISSAGVDNSKTDFNARINDWVSDSAQNAAWRVFFPDFLDSQGKNGLTLMGNIVGIDSSDCSDCDTCPWVSEFDFTTDPYTAVFFQRDAVWTDGIGYTGVNQGGAALNDATLYANIDSTTFESMDILYDADGTDSGSNVNFRIGTGGNWPSGAVAYGTDRLGVSGHNLHFHVDSLQSGVTSFRVDMNFGTVMTTNPLKHLTLRGTGTKPSQLP